MNKKTLRIAEEILKAAEDLIFADSDYIYDPEHKKKPSGGYHKTEKGWSKKEEKKEKSTSTKSYKVTEEYALYNIARNKNTSAETLDKLSNEKSLDIRIQVARNKNTSVETLDKLSNDGRSDVRRGVAYNKNTSAKTLDKLSNDEDKDVRLNVASNKNTSAETFDKLSNDKNDDVRREVAKNPKTPIETLEKMSKADKSTEGIGQAARFNLYNRKKEVGQRNWKNNGFDTSKLSPELRGNVEYWDAEDIKKFIAWLKEHKG